MSGAPRSERIISRLAGAAKWINAVLLPFLVVAILAIVVAGVVSLFQQRDLLEEGVQADRDGIQRSAVLVQEAIEQLEAGNEQRLVRLDEAEAKRADLILAELHELRHALYAHRNMYDSRTDRPGDAPAPVDRVEAAPVPDVTPAPRIQEPPPPAPDTPGRQIGPAPEPEEDCIIRLLICIG